MLVWTGLLLSSEVGGKGELAVLLASFVVVVGNKGAGDAMAEVGALLQAKVLGSSGDGLRRCFLDLSIVGIIVVSSSNVGGDLATIGGLIGDDVTFVVVVVVVVVAGVVGLLSDL